MARSFAEYLRQFALSVDVVNPEIFGDLKTLIDHYVREALSVEYFEFMRSGTVDGGPGLITLWPSEGYLSNSLRDPINGEYQGHTAYAFDKNVSLWVVSPDRSPLAVAGKYVDLWSGRTDLPSYVTPGNLRDLIRTAIVIPLKENGRVFGVLDFESTRYVGITDAAKRELSAIAESISILYSLERINSQQRMSTKGALSELARTLKSKRLPRLSKPKIFLAFSGMADHEVLGVIRRVLADYDDRLEIVAWDEVARSGNITEHIVDEILSSRYGICYFSEPVGGIDPPQYRDNPNVLIEAGMLHALHHADSDLAGGWIPIRETNSPSVPFDFVTERRLNVPRDNHGKLNEHQFVATLRKRIDELLHT